MEVTKPVSGVNSFHPPSTTEILKLADFGLRLGVPYSLFQFGLSLRICEEEHGDLLDNTNHVAN